MSERDIRLFVADRKTYSATLREFVEDDIRLRLLKHISASSSHLTQRDFAGYQTGR